MNEELSAAIFDFAQNCRSGSVIVPSDVGRGLSVEQSNEWVADVNDLCGELNDLAAQALERRVSRSEFVIIEARLRAIHASPGGGSISRVQTAFDRRGGAQ